MKNANVIIIHQIKYNGYSTIPQGVDGVPDMTKYISLWLVVLATAFSATAADIEKETLDYLTKKTIDDFHKGIENYNTSKDVDVPVIKKVKAQVYQFKAKTNTVHFSIVNYLNDQIYINNRQVTKSTFGIPKTTSWFDRLITPAHAEEDDLDAESTKIILTALGGLSRNLEEVGMICFAGCQKEIRGKNLKKILATLDRENSECAVAAEAQEDTINKFSSYKMVSMLHSTFNPEFQSVKNLFQKVAEANRKSVNAFMENKLAIEKNYQSCVGIMTAGTVADGSYDSMSRGIAVLKAGGVASIAMESAIEQAKSICVKMDSLKSCLLTVKKNLASINNIKRAEKRRTGQEYSPQENLPNIDSIAR